MKRTRCYKKHLKLSYLLLCSLNTLSYLSHISRYLQIHASKLCNSTHLQTVFFLQTVNPAEEFKLIHAHNNLRLLQRYALMLPGKLCLLVNWQLLLSVFHKYFAEGTNFLYNCVVQTNINQIVTSIYILSCFELFVIFVLILKNLSFPLSTLQSITNICPKNIYLN